MILILSERSDITTYHISKWMAYFGKEVYIITDEDPINSICIENSDVSLSVNDKVIKLRDVEAYWYRRGFFNFQFCTITKDFPETIINDLKKEKSSLSEILHTYLQNVPSLSSIFNSDLNRICILQKAKEAGFSVPNFGIYSSKNGLKDFFSEFSRIITKPIWNGLTINEENILYFNHTSEFSKDNLNELPDEFSPSLFLEYIDKKYEVRVFYLNRDCYSMAILSQNDEKTKIDFRRYNIEKPNRNVPYLLPQNIKKKICKLMRKVGLKTGSIDIIVTPDDEFVFLEINPIGQFLNVSHICNYNIEKKIAEYLINIAQ